MSTKGYFESNEWRANSCEYSKNVIWSPWPHLTNIWCIRKHPKMWCMWNEDGWHRTMLWIVENEWSSVTRADGWLKWCGENWGKTNYFFEWNIFGEMAPFCTALTLVNNKVAIITPSKYKALKWEKQNGYTPITQQAREKRHKYHHASTSKKVILEAP